MNVKNKIKKLKIGLTNISIQITSDIYKLSESIYKRFKNNSSILEYYILKISKKFKSKKYVQGILTFFELIISFVLTVLIIVCFIFPLF